MNSENRIAPQKVEVLAGLLKVTSGRIYQLVQDVVISQMMIGHSKGYDFYASILRTLNASRVLPVPPLPCGSFESQYPAHFEK